MNEEWKPVMWYEWMYEVSNIWRVRSIYDWRHKRNRIKYISIQTQKWWHWLMVLHKDCVKKAWVVSRLVAQAFIPNPDNLPCACHIKEDLDENWALYNGEDNLFWGTYSDNARDRQKKWRWSKNFITNNPSPSKWKFWKDNFKSKKIKQLDLNWNFIREWWSQVDVYRELWIWNTNISKCCKWELETAWWYKWEMIQE